MKICNFEFIHFFWCGPQYLKIPFIVRTVKNDGLSVFYKPTRFLDNRCQSLIVIARASLALHWQTSLQSKYLKQDTNLTSHSFWTMFKQVLKPTVLNLFNVLSTVNPFQSIPLYDDFILLNTTILNVCIPCFFYKPTTILVKQIKLSFTIFVQEYLLLYVISLYNKSKNSAYFCRFLIKNYW